jgi:23S rRNA (cytosine1962-C5)-methyltransferase
LNTLNSATPEEPVLVLKPGREKTVMRRHPWIFSGAVGEIVGEPKAGETVAIHSSAGAFLARAAYSPKSQISARIWTWNPDEEINQAFFESRIRGSLGKRAELTHHTNAMRLINAESDGLPGLFADKYGDVVVCQFLTVGAERWKTIIASLLMSLSGASTVYERSDVDVRAKEGLATSEGVLCGGPISGPLEIWEENPQDSVSPWNFLVDVQTGHKTGFYLDQRDNRRIVAELAGQRDVLNVFAYTGAFTVTALAGGARSTVSIDSSGPSLMMARQNLERNGLPPDGLLEADAFKALREYRDSGSAFDLIVLDPPKFARTMAQVNRAARAYKDLNWLAFRLLRPGGYLVTFSCSGAISEDLFQKILFGAALDAGRDVQIVRRLGQASDHPVLLSFPEAAYLKGFVCLVA